MRDALSSSCYKLDPDLQVWMAPDYKGIPYNDGDAVECAIEAAVDSSEDLSIFSSELALKCSDWPTFYHLSSCRGNILRPFERRLRGAAVLEIGAGCGAITRYLGESGADVLALEGSVRRARIARKRTRGLSNVEVLAENFSNFDTSCRFDIITLIGVLEYAPRFIPGEDPVLSMLSRTKALLKPGGILIIAIENKLGLKYFAGAREDHTGIEMFGVEGRYQDGGAITFGQEELRSLLEKARFPSVRFLSPLPDYKAPVSIITEAGFASADFDVAALTLVSVARDRQLTSQLSFSIQHAWKTVLANKLGLQLANSFLIVAQNSDETALDPSILAYHYNTNRISSFCKSTVFRRTREEKIAVQYTRLCPGISSEKDPGEIRMILPESADYVHGIQLSERLRAVLEKPGWEIQEVVSFLVNYLHWLEGIGAGVLVQNGRCNTSAEIDGRFFDVIPQNILALPSGEWRCIDTEWVLMKPIALDWLLFRVLFAAINSTPCFEKSHNVIDDSRISFIKKVFEALGHDLNLSEIRKLGEMEADLQSAILGVPVAEDFWLPDQSIFRSSNVFEKARQLKQLELEVAARDAQLGDVHQQLLNVVDSPSWKLTAPLRYVKRAGIKCLRAALGG